MLSASVVLMGRAALAGLGDTIVDVVVSSNAVLGVVSICCSILRRVFLLLILLILL